MNVATTLTHPQPSVHSAKDAYAIFRPLMNAPVEEFWIMALTSAKTCFSTELLFRGTVDTCLVHPRDVFRFACLNNASSVIVAHNHPSGDARPSDADLVFTRRLIRASRMMEIPLLDHLILVRDGYVSLATQKFCSFPI